VSVAVELAELRDKVAEYGAVAFLVTVGADGAAHVVSTAVEMTGDAITAPAGRTTAANADRAGSITVLWPARPGERYCLIVDGTATVEDGAVTVGPVRAVLHRVADAPDDGPTCVPIVDQRATR
jgi:hypothetical protein